MASKENSKIPKGLPKRCRNDNKKAKRKRCWEAAQRRKAANKAANHAAWEANEAYRRQGLPTPYEARQRDRANHTR